MLFFKIFNSFSNAHLYEKKESNPIAKGMNHDLKEPEKGQKNALAKNANCHAVNFFLKEIQTLLRRIKKDKLYEK